MSVHSLCGAVSHALRSILTGNQHAFLCGAQAQHDYLAGNYPVVREDAAQMCALQMQAEVGPTHSANDMDAALERWVTKQVGSFASLTGWP